MPRIRSVFVLGVLLAASPSVRAQVTSGVLYVNNTHMV